MEKLVKLMVQKGWPKEDIEYTLHLLDERKHKHARMQKNMDNFVYWTSLLVIALTNFIGSFFLIPFFFIFTGANLLFFIIVFAFIFGLLFNFIIMGIEQLQWQHHLFALIIIPLLTIFDIRIMLNFTEIIGKEFERTFMYEANLIIVIFVFTFVTPYLFSIIIGKHKIHSPYRHSRLKRSIAHPDVLEESLPDVDERMMHYSLDSFKHGEEMDKISIRKRKKAEGTQEANAAMASDNKKKTVKRSGKNKKKTAARSKKKKKKKREKR